MIRIRSKSACAAVALLSAAAVAAQDSRPAVPLDDAVAELTARIAPELRAPADSARRDAWIEAGAASEDGALREAAVREAAAAGASSAPLLERLAASPSWRARASAAETLLRFDDAALAAARPAAEAIAERGARDGNRAVRRAAARLLGALDGHGATLEVLTRDAFFDVRAEAVRSCARVSGTAALAFVAARLDDEDEAVRETAVQALANRGDAGVRRLGAWLASGRGGRPLRLRALQGIWTRGAADAARDALSSLAARAREDDTIKIVAIALASAAGDAGAARGACAGLLNAAIAGPELWIQEAAFAALRTLGPDAADKLRDAAISRPLQIYVFKKLVAALVHVAGGGARQLLASVFDALPSGSDDERAVVVGMLGRKASAEMIDWLSDHWQTCGESARLEALRTLRGREDLPGAFCGRAVRDDSRDVRRAAFPLVMQNVDFPTRECIDAIQREKDATLRSEWLELLPRRRPDPMVRDFLLRELRAGDLDYLESIAAGLDSFHDDDVIGTLIQIHDRAYVRQIEGDAADAESHWRVRRMVVRTLTRIGGPASIAFLRTRARADRAVDEELAAEATRGVAALSPDDAVLLDLMQPPSLRGVRVEAAIAATRAGHAQAVLVLARYLRSLDGDARRRAFDAFAVGKAERHRDILQLLAVDTAQRFSDEARTDAIRDLSALPGDDALKSLAQIALSDRSLEARIEAVLALGRRGGDDAAAALLRVADLAARNGTAAAELDPLQRAIARALGTTRSPAAVPRLLIHLFERPLADGAQRLAEADLQKSAHERSRQYDRELDAVNALIQLGRPCANALESAFDRLRAAGVLRLMDAVFLLDVADAWLETFPETARCLAHESRFARGDFDTRFRALWIDAQTQPDRAAAAHTFELLASIAATGGADAAMAKALGDADPGAGRIPFAWLAAAPDASRALAAFAAGKRDDGVSLMNAARRAGKHDLRFLADAGTWLSEHGLPDAALATAGEARALNDDDRGACEQWAWMLLRAGRADEALAAFREALTIEDDDDPAGAGAWIGAAACWVKLGRDAEAKQALRTLAVASPDALRSAARIPALRPLAEAVRRESAPAPEPPPGEQR